MLDVTVGHEVECSIVYLDQNGNPMQTTPTPDAPPQWSNQPATPPIDSLMPSADGSSCEVDTLAPGTDTIGLSVIVGGQTFNASLQLAIEAPPQVLTSVQIATNVS